MKTLELQTHPGQHITEACQLAAAKASTTGHPVHFVFNETNVTAQPGESAEVLEARWRKDMDAAHEAWVNSPEYKQREAEREAEEKRKREAHLTETAQSETEMREATVPTPYTKEQLAEYVDSLVSRSHDYGTCCYAMSMAATAAFNYVAHMLGVTGFQASCADLDILRRTRNIKGPFMVVDAEKALYPQYDLHANLAEAMEKWQPWLKEQAEKHLAVDANTAHPAVVEHWKKLGRC